MTRIHERIETDLPIDAAFDYIADFANSHDWDPGTAWSRGRAATTARSGSARRSSWTCAWAAASRRWTYRIRDFERPDRVVLVGAGSGVDAVDDIRFERVGDGTVIDYTADIRLGGCCGSSQPFLGRDVRGGSDGTRPPGMDGTLAGLADAADDDGRPADARRDHRWRDQRPERRLRPPPRPRRPPVRRRVAGRRPRQDRHGRHGRTGRSRSTWASSSTTTSPIRRSCG